MSQLNKLNKAQEDASSKMIENNPLKKLYKEPKINPAQELISSFLESNSTEKQNKENEKKEAAAEALRTRCKTCFKEISPKRICGGHGGGGGGGGSTSTESEKGSGAAEPEDMPSEIKSKSGELSFDQVNEEGLKLTEHLTEADLLFDLERVKELFLIDNDSERGILTIRAKPGHSSNDDEEIQRYLEAINAVFEQFKIVLEQKGIPVEHFTCILNKNELVIRIPSPKYFDAFIQELLTKQLLPVISPKLDDEKQSVVTSPTPFAKSPPPSVSKKEDLDDVARASYSPFSIELKPKSVIER